jgi:hypothetical protein
LEVPTKSEEKSTHKEWILIKLVKH